MRVCADIFGRHGRAWLGAESHGVAGHGKAGGVGRGRDGTGKSGLGMAGNEMHGNDRLGMTRHGRLGTARHGAAKRGDAGKALMGLVERGWARSCTVQQARLCVGGSALCGHAGTATGTDPWRLGETSGFSTDKEAVCQKQ